MDSRQINLIIVEFSVYDNKKNTSKAKQIPTDFFIVLIYYPLPFFL